jgi:anti-anti-sigma regulatory factor
MALHAPGPGQLAVQSPGVAMAMHLRQLPTPGSGVTAIAINGTADREVQLCLDELVALLPEQGQPYLVLDLSNLTSINNELAVALLELHKTLEDRSGGLEFCGTNAVVRWFLQQHLGDLPVQWHETPDEAIAVFNPEWAQTDETVDEETDEPLRPEPRLPHDAVRPDRFSVSALSRLMSGDKTPAELLENVESLLKRCGLTQGCRLVHRQDNELMILDREQYGMQADGWLGSLLAGAGCPMARTEIGEDGLSHNERAFLIWSACDIYIPLMFAGALTGILCLQSDRPAGLWSYRSGEILALSLMAQMLADKLQGELRRKDDPRPARESLTPQQIDERLEDLVSSALPMETS